jgi:hypothetical protein
MEDISRLEKRVEDLQPKKDLLHSILNTYEYLIEQTLGEYDNSHPNLYNPKISNVNDTASEYLAASFIQFICSSKHSDKLLHPRDAKGANEKSSELVIDAKQYIYNLCVYMIKDITTYTVVRAENNISSTVTLPNLKLLTELNATRSKGRTALAYELENRKSEYERGLITALYNAISGGVALKDIGSKLSTSYPSRSRESPADTYPKYREYWGITKGLRELQVKRDSE